MNTTHIDRIWVLRLGSIYLGVEPKALKEVLEIAQSTPVPLAPPPLLGLLSHQGQIVPLFDLSRVLQVPPADSTTAALLEVEGQSIAFMIDEVVGLRTHLSGSWATPSQEPLFSAVLQDSSQSIRVLNESRLLEYLATRMSASNLSTTAYLQT